MISYLEIRKISLVYLLEIKVICLIIKRFNIFDIKVII